MKLGKQVGLGPGHIVLDRDPGPLLKGTQPPIFGHSCCGQMARLIKMPLDAEVGLDLSDIVLDGDPASSPPKGGRSPNFRPTFVVPNGWMEKDATWYDARPRPGQHCVRCGPSSTPKGHSPQISAHVCCSQTARWIKMPLSTKVGLGPAAQDALCYMGTQILPPERGTTQFSTHVYGGQTVAHLSYCCMSTCLFLLCSLLFLWPPCVADAHIIFLPCGFFYLLSSFFLAYSQPSHIGCLLHVLPHMVWP